MRWVLPLIAATVMAGPDLAMTADESNAAWFREMLLRQMLGARIEPAPRDYVKQDLQAGPEPPPPPFTTPRGLFR